MSDQDQNESKTSEEIIRLSVAAHSGDISEADADRLNALLAESESARQTFLLAAQDTHDLRDWATEYAFRLTIESDVTAGQDATCSTSIQPTNLTLQGTPLGRWERTPLRFLPRVWQTAASIAAAVSIAAIAGVLGWRVGQMTQQPTLAGAALEMSPSIAQLTMANGCSWGGGSPQFTKLDSQVRSGDGIALHEGIAEFRLSSGVSLSIEGPAALVLTSPTSLVLQHGRVTVYVPSTNEDFRLATPVCRITGGQAEFGVQVAGGDVDVHVFAGQVVASPALGNEQADDQEAFSASDDGGKSGDVFFRTTIEAGRGLALAGGSDDAVVARWHDADESQFATRLSMAGPLPITKAYVDSVLTSKPLGYWRFESAKGNLVPNEIGGLAGLAISGKVYLAKDGRNHSVELGRPGFDGALYCKHELNLPPQSDYSVEAWIKPSHYHNGSVVSMHITPQAEGETKESTAFYLQTTAAIMRDPALQRRIRFLHRDPPGSNSSTGTNCFSNVLYRLRRWQHIVAVKQGPEMKLYLDGSVVDTQREPGSLAPHLHMIVGQLGETAGLQRFIGQLDELAIYPQALSSEEIAQHFKLIDWRPKQSMEISDKGI